MQTLQKTSSSPAGDAELLASFSSGESDSAFSELVRRHLPLVLAVTRRRLGNSGLAEDAAQQVFIALSRRLRQRREIPCLAAWLQKAAVYEASCLARKERRHRRRNELAGELWAGADDPVDDPRLDQALASLHDRDREILLLHHFENLSFARVAERLGISEAAAQRRGHRALERLGKLVRSRGIDRDAKFFGIWLAGPLASNDIAASSDLVARVSTLKHSAVQSLPWLPIAAVLTLAGGTWATVNALRPAPESASPVVSTTTLPSRERPATRKFTPFTSDEKLSPEIREFISRAKVDSKDAWEWVKQRPEGVYEFIQEGARALADRDLAAADRFLEVVDGPMPRMYIIGNIATSRASGNFESAVLWVDSFPGKDDRKAVGFSGCTYVNSEHMNHDYAGALGFARSAEVREWLINQACEKAAATDETQIEKLAAGLKDNERRIALAHVASLLLQRGDPRGYELLTEADIDASQLPDIAEIARRDAQGLLGRLLPTSQDNASAFANLWHSWCRRDADAAAAWAAGLDAEGQRLLSRFYPSDPTFRRIRNQP